MGRIFETRKHVMFARWDKMSKMFTRISKDIAIAVKASGPNPDNNPSLRRIIQNLIEDPLAEGLLEGRYKPGMSVIVDVEDDLLRIVTADTLAAV